MATERQVSANRKNGLKGGVKTEEGKAVSRLNARTHGIFASSLTPEDADELRGTEEELIADMRPVGRLEGMLVEKIAVTYLRMQRCARAEGKYNTRVWKVPKGIEGLWERDCLEPEKREYWRKNWFDMDEMGYMIKLISVYDARLTSQFQKLIREFEHVQKLRAERGDGDEAAPQAAEEPNRRAAEPETTLAPEAASAEPAPAPAAGKPAPVAGKPAPAAGKPAPAAGKPTSAATETSSPPAQPSVAQPPSPRSEPRSATEAVMTPASHSAQPRADVPHAQVVDAEEAAATGAFEKTNPFVTG